jgi:hypothetical protein
VVSAFHACRWGEEGRRLFADGQTPPPGLAVGLCDKDSVTCSGGRAPPSWLTARKSPYVLDVKGRESRRAVGHAEPSGG